MIFAVAKTIAFAATHNKLVLNAQESAQGSTPKKRTPKKRGNMSDAERRAILKDMGLL